LAKSIISARTFSTCTLDHLVTKSVESAIIEKDFGFMEPSQLIAYQCSSKPHSFFTGIITFLTWKIHPDEIYCFRTVHLPTPHNHLIEFRPIVQKYHPSARPAQLLPL